MGFMPMLHQIWVHPDLTMSSESDPAQKTKIETIQKNGACDDTKMLSS